jgi:hypothetical protein
VAGGCQRLKLGVAAKANVMYQPAAMITGGSVVAASWLMANMRKYYVGSSSKKA